MHRKHILLHAGLVIALLLPVAWVVCSVFSFCGLGTGPDGGSSGIGIFSERGRESDGIRTFGSEEEFRRYVTESAATGSGAPEVRTLMSAGPMRASATDFSMETAYGQAGIRVSGTNVRTEGVDEPDIVKVDGNHIYFSREERFMFREIPVPMPIPLPAVDLGTVSSGRPDMTESVGVGAVAPEYRNPPEGTDIFLLDDPESPERIGSIAKNGETLLFGDTLVLFEASGRSVIGYDISDRRNPTETWAMSLGDESGILEARKIGDALYLVERTGIVVSDPCPIRPFSVGGTVSEIACTDIYRDGNVADADAVFSVFRVDPSDGTAGTPLSFVGSSSRSVAYMGESSLFLTSVNPADSVSFFLGFLREYPDLFPSDLADRIDRLSGYDIGSQAKSVELSRLVGNAFLGKDPDELLKLRTEIGNRMTEYRKRHLRDGESTGIVKISLDGLRIVASGSVPGAVLDDFSLDEYDGTLRVATTVGGDASFPYFLGGIPTGTVASANDVSVLDDSLRKIGGLPGLGEDERIYSARFIGDRGYLVTFRETDPFYVLDLSDPTNPKKLGELKIPGYSSYLHPLGGHLVLGIGKEDQRVKLSLFDVADPADPKEVSKYTLDEYWSEAVSDHRAFLADTLHGVFFLPGSKGGYVFSYRDDALSLVVSAAGSRVRRAVFVGDTLYVVGEDAIVSYDERTWEKKGELDVSR